MVVDGGASLRMALTGDQVLSRAINNGWHGLVLNCCVRDGPIVRELNIVAKAPVPHPGKRTRIGDGRRNIPINIKVVTLTTGDFISCYECGVVVLPREIALGHMVERG